MTKTTMSTKTNANYRNRLGIVCFFVLAIVIGLLAEVVMVGREIYQWKHYHLPKFEWDDVVRYSIAILLGCALHYSYINY